MIDITEVRDALRGQGVDEHEYVNIRQFVIDLWENATRYKWNLRTAHIERFRTDSKGQDEFLFLTLRPVSTVTKVEIGDNSKAVTTLDSTKYEILGVGTLRRIDSFWERFVKVTYDGGYFSTTTPFDIRRALLLQAQFVRNRFSQEKIAISSLQGESGSTNFLHPVFHPFFTAVAQKYKRK
jgi:hypothetical protein